MPSRSREIARKTWNAWYARQPTSYKKSIAAKNAVKRREMRQFITKYKASNPCKCGEAHPACLDFHHLGLKTINLGTTPSRGWSLERVMTEISKCVVMCSNCHRKMHWDAGETGHRSHPTAAQ